MNAREKKGNKPVKSSSSSAPSKSSISSSAPSAASSAQPPSKRSNSRRNKQAEDSEFSPDDHSDEIRNGSNYQIGSFEAVLAQNLEMLSEKRGSTREEGLASINNILSANFARDFVASNQVTLEENLKRCISKGSASEKRQAYKSAALVAISGGQSVAESIVAEMGQSFRDTIKNSDADDATRAAAMTFYSMILFVGLRGDMLEVNEVMKTFLEADLIDQKANRQAGSKMLLAAVVDAWTLLASMITTAMLNDTVFPRVINKFNHLLSHDDFEVKQSTGEALALLFEQQRTSNEDYSPEEKYSSLLDTLDELAGEFSRSKATKDTKKTRTTFKNIASSIIDGTSPSESLLINRQSVSVKGWKKVIQLNAFRDVLSVGFHAHFIDNDLLHFCFGTSIVKNLPSGKGSSERVVNAPNSAIAKERSKKLKKDRGERSNALSLADLE